MCGIAGCLGERLQGESYARQMVQALRHRGPDAYGIKSWGTATLAHTRLSIIDLSPAGRQPMSNEDGTIWTVFNGEIYNYRELRHHLQKRGHVFRGHSDTQVLPHLYEEEGPNFVTRLQGMFALAIYDTKSRTLILTRDRFGIKPLFYAAGKNRLAFASEIRALLQLPDIDTRPDSQAIYDFAALFYIPAPETFYRGIRALQPGEMLEAHLENGIICSKARIYHRWAIPLDPGITLAHATDRADELLTAAVQRQLQSDVPLGSLLSGGIDSSLISVAAQEALGGGLRTFNVRFSQKDYDETWAAAAVANHIASCHQTLDMTTSVRTWEFVTSLLLHAGQPFADTSLFAVSAVCKLMRQHVTVAVSGDGGDEAFGGYEIYWQLARIARWQRLPAPIWYGASIALGPLSQFGIISPSFRRRLGDLAGADNTDVVQSLFSWIPKKEHEDLCQQTDVLPIRRFFEPQWEFGMRGHNSRLERLSAHATEINIRLVLPNDFLFKVDLASMKESLEIRVPMLDEDLFAFALSLPHHLKVKGRRCKQVLRAIASRKLPPEIATKPKFGFAIPLGSWIDADFRMRLRETLLSSSSNLPAYFRPEVYRPVIEACCAGRPYNGVSPQGLYHRAIMLLAAELALGEKQHTSDNLACST